MGNSISNNNITEFKRQLKICQCPLFQYLKFMSHHMKTVLSFSDNRNIVSLIEQEVSRKIWKKRLFIKFMNACLTMQKHSSFLGRHLKNTLTAIF